MCATILVAATTGRFDIGDEVMDTRTTHAPAADDAATVAAQIHAETAQKVADPPPQPAEQPRGEIAKMHAKAVKAVWNGLDHSSTNYDIARCQAQAMLDAAHIQARATITAAHIIADTLDTNRA